MFEPSKGPWRLADEDEVYGRLVRAPDGLVIAALCDGDGADARLVAAAPELLEALEAVLENWPDPATFSSEERARALIARVRGR